MGKTMPHLSISLNSRIIQKRIKRSCNQRRNIMKLDKQEPQEEEQQNHTLDKTDENGSCSKNGEAGIRFQCRSCAAPMIAVKDNAVQCEILTGNNKNDFLGLTSDVKNGSRRGSVQSICEVQEDVSCHDNVKMETETAAPDEILLVTRSFENQPSPVQPRRSSIAQFLSNITSLASRSRPDPAVSRQFLDESHAEPQTALRSGIRRGSVGLVPVQDGSDAESHISSPGRTLHRKSVQLDDGAVLDEAIEEHDADAAVAADESIAPGEVSIVTRSFENVQQYQPRRESIFDKLNFVKKIPLFRNNDNESPRKPEVSEDPSTRLAVSGVRRKSLAPAMLGIQYDEDNESEDDERSTQGATAAAATSQVVQSDPSPMRYVTSGIRRGSVAAVSAAPPCRDPNQGQDKSKRLAAIEDEDTEQNARLVTDGIRRGSVAMVSAAPPCFSQGPDGVSLSPSHLRKSSNELDVDVLRSGVRRRSLTPASEKSPESSPKSSPEASNRMLLGSLSNMTYNDEDYEESESAADEFMNRVNKRIEKAAAKGKPRKKGCVDLFETLTGREMGTDYSSADAKRIQEKIDAEEEEKARKFDRGSIPTITLSFDNVEEVDNKETVEETEADKTNDAKNKQ